MRSGTKEAIARPQAGASQSLRANDMHAWLRTTDPVIMEKGEKSGGRVDFNIKICRANEILRQKKKCKKPMKLA